MIMLSIYIYTYIYIRYLKSMGHAGMACFFSTRILKFRAWKHHALFVQGWLKGQIKSNNKMVHVKLCCSLVDVLFLNYWKSRCCCWTACCSVSKSMFFSLTLCFFPVIMVIVWWNSVGFETHLRHICLIAAAPQKMPKSVQPGWMVVCCCPYSLFQVSREYWGLTGDVSLENVPSSPSYPPMSHDFPLFFSWFLQLFGTRHPQFPCFAGPGLWSGKSSKKSLPLAASPGLGPAMANVRIKLMEAQSDFTFGYMYI